MQEIIENNYELHHVFMMSDLVFIWIKACAKLINVIAKHPNLNLKCLDSTTLHFAEIF